MNAEICLQRLLVRLETMAVNEGGEVCSECEGDGMFWADGKAHPPFYQGSTVPCARCAGVGTTYNIRTELRTAIDEARVQLDKPAPPKEQP